MSRALLDDVVLKLIDALLIKNGHVTSRDVYKHVGLGRQKVSTLFQIYLNQNPNSMSYVPSKRKYIVSDSFKPQFLNEDEAEIFIKSLEIVFGTFT